MWYTCIVIRVCLELLQQQKVVVHQIRVSYLYLASTMDCSSENKRPPPHNEQGRFRHDLGSSVEAASSYKLYRTK